jgi:hypothetical protein
VAKESAIAKPIVTPMRNGAASRNSERVRRGFRGGSGAIMRSVIDIREPPSAEAKLRATCRAVSCAFPRVCTARAAAARIGAVTFGNTTGIPFRLHSMRNERARPLRWLPLVKTTLRISGLLVFSLTAVLAACSEDTTSAGLRTAPDDRAPGVPQRTYSDDAGALLQPETSSTLPPAKAPCVLDTRTVYIQNGLKIESITAFGMYWSRELLSDWVWEEGAGFPKKLEDEPKFANGPCTGQAECRLDSRVVYFDIGNNKKIESTTAYGKYFNWSFDDKGAIVPTPGFPQLLSQTPAFQVGPCASDLGGCKLDTRSIYFFGGVKLETITAYGSVWTYAIDPSNGARVAQAGSGAPLTSIPRYVLGPCSGLGKGGVCTFDTRTVYYDKDGSRREEVTARGKLWTWILGPTDAVLDTPQDGVVLQAIPRFAGICGST